jgi:hypothetical protein
MIEIRPLNPVHSVGDPDPLIGTFPDSVWQDLIELAQRYGFESLDIENYYPPHRYGEPVEMDAETSQRLWEVIRVVYHDDVVPPSLPPDVGRLRVKQLMECAQIGAVRGGIEIRRSREEEV